MGVPRVINFNGIFPYKPNSYWGSPFMETPLCVGLNLFWVGSEVKVSFFLDLQG